MIPSEHRTEGIPKPAKRARIIRETDGMYLEDTTSGERLYGPAWSYGALGRYASMKRITIV